MYCHDNTLEDCNLTVNTGSFQDTENLLIEKSGDVEEISWTSAENATMIRVSVQKRYRSPLGITFEINNDYSKTRVRLVPLGKINICIMLDNMDRCTHEGLNSWAEISKMINKFS